MSDIRILGTKLRAAPRPLAQAVVPTSAIGPRANAGWATAPVTAVVNQRANAVVLPVQDAAWCTGPASPLPSGQEG